MVKTVNFVMPILPWLKIIIQKKEKEAKVPAHPWRLCLTGCWEKHRGRSPGNGLPGRTTRISIHLPPTSFPIPELFIIKELLEMKCELGAQLDFVLSCFTAWGAAWVGGAGVCRALLWLVAKASTWEAECGVFCSLCRRCSFQDIILGPFKLAL